MKITICGSIAVILEMNEAKKALEAQGFEVEIPPMEVERNGETISALDHYKEKKVFLEDPEMHDRVAELMRLHFSKIDWADAVLILNLDKKGIPGYIGGNTLVEMGLAYYQRKPIFLYNPAPEISYKEEIYAMHPIVLNGDLTKIMEYARTA